VEILYLLVPLAVLIAVLIAAALLWAVRSGQFDDLEGPAHRILMDDDGPVAPRTKPDTTTGTTSGTTPADPSGRLEPPADRR
jgi:cbb3-type cytochrome oxidase maturation protein